MEYKFDFTGKNVLITGGSRGLGRAFAQGFASLGAKIILAARNIEKLEETAKLIEEAGGYKPVIIPCDVTDLTQIDDMLEKVDKVYGRIDVLINNAGVGHKIPAEKVPPEEWRRVLATNLDAPFYISTKVANKFMIPQNSGNIINIASMGGFMGIPGGAAYSSSKAGLLNMTRSLAAEWAKYGIRINCLCPHYTVTDMVRPLMKYDAWMQLVKARTPMGRLAQPEEMVGACLFMASDMASYMTGSYIQVDGGCMAGGF